MISLFINELPTLSAFNDNDRVLIDSTYTLAAEMSTMRDYMFESRVIPSMSATNLIVTNLSALSSTFVTLDVINYELSGFNITGELTLSPNELYQYAIRTETTTGAITLPVGTTNQQPSPPLTGALRFNTTDNAFEGYNGVEWGALGETTAARFVDIGAGNIVAGSTVPKGTSLQNLVDLLFVKEFFPTLGTNTAITLASWTVGGQTGNPTIVEAGTQGITINASYNDGSILGKTDGIPWNPPTEVTGVWSPGVEQNRLGPATPTDYTIFDTTFTTTSLSQSNTSAARVMIDGNNLFTSQLTHGTGEIPYSSKGTPMDGSLPGYPAMAGSLLGASYTRSATLTIVGARYVWWAVSVVGTIDPAAVRSFANKIFNQFSANTVSFNITIPTGTTNVVFAVPNDISRSPQVIQSGGGFDLDISAIFTSGQAAAPTNLDIPGANGYLATGDRRAYKIYKFTPPDPFDNTYTWSVTI